MKLQHKTGIIVLLLLLVSFTSGAQTVTRKWTGQDLKTVLRDIESQTGLSIFYRSDEVDETLPVTADFNGAPVETVLRSILGNDISARIEGKMIILSRKDVKAPGLVRGRVIDPAGEPVPGAGVFVKGTKNGVSTDFDGRFSIEAETEQLRALASI